MKLRPIKNHIIFKFVDKIVVRSDLGKRRTQFQEETDSGIVLTSFDESAKHPRWAIVEAVGPDVTDKNIIAGSKVLIEGLKWTEAIEVDGDDVWRTDEEWLLAIEE
jgi:co-chaperonin GroES (HSP10)